MKGICFILLLTLGGACTGIPYKANNSESDVIALIKTLQKDVHENKVMLQNLTEDVHVVTDVLVEEWPEGSYGIVSYGKCPQGWYEFIHCQDTEDTNNNDDTTQFRPVLPKCTSEDFTLRYCFKGAEIKTRKGGFWTTTEKYGSAYVVKNTGSDCSAFGRLGGTVYIDNEDSGNGNKFGNNGFNGQKYDHYHPEGFLFKLKVDTHLEFCKIGELGNSITGDYIGVGLFDQKFGLFVVPGQKCPTLRSPYGLLKGTPQRFHLDDEDDNNEDNVSADSPVILGEGGSNWCVCQYDPDTFHH